MEKEKTMEELLKEKLFYKKVNAFTKDDESYFEAVKNYAENYKAYLDLVTKVVLYKACLLKHLNAYSNSLTLCL